MASRTTPSFPGEQDDFENYSTTQADLLYIETQLARLSLTDGATHWPALDHATRFLPPNSHEWSTPDKPPAIDILPDELMEEIFFQTQDDEVDAGFRRRTVASVCRKWRNLAISCRRLWYWVACVPKSRKSRALLDLFVSRAEGRIRELTLTDITLTEDEIDFRTLGDVLKPSTCEGIKGLIIQTREACNVENLAQWRLNLPNVEYIRVQMVESGNGNADLVIPTPFFLKFPRATKLELHDFMPALDVEAVRDSLPPVTTIELTRYNLGSLSDHVVAMLNCFPNLQRLQLDGYIQPTPMYFGHHLIMHNITHLTFTVSDIFGSAAAFRDAVQFPNLQYLGTLAYPIPDLGTTAFPFISDFFTMQSNTKSLKTLRLILQPDPEEISIPENATSMAQQLGCLCSLRYVERLELDSDTFKDNVITPAYLEQVLAVLQTLLCTLPPNETLFPVLTGLHFSAMRMLRLPKVLEMVKARRATAEQALDSLTHLEAVTFEGCEAMTKEQLRELHELTRPSGRAPGFHVGRIGQTHRSI